MSAEKSGKALRRWRHCSIFCPHQAHLALGPGVGQRDMNGLGVTAVARNGNDGHAESGRDQTLHRRDLGGLEDDVRVDVLLRPEFVGELPQAELVAKCDERFLGRRGQPYPGSAGEPVPARNGQTELFDIQPPPNKTTPLGTRRGDGDVGLAAPHPLRDLVRGPLEQVESDRGHRIPETSKLFGYIPIRQRMKKGQSYPAGIRIAQCGNAFGGGMHFGQAASCVLEHDLAVSVQSEPAIDPVEQWCTGLVFESRQCARQCRLADP